LDVIIFLFNVVSLGTFHPFHHFTIVGLCAFLGDAGRFGTKTLRVFFVVFVS